MPNVLSPQGRNQYKSTPEESVFSETLGNVDIGYEATDDPIDSEREVSVGSEIDQIVERSHAILVELSQRGHRIAQVRAAELGADTHSFSLRA